MSKKLKFLYFDVDFIIKVKQKWYFILKKYDQSVLQETNEYGVRIGSISHILRIFLIDEEYPFTKL